jgi:hypothetical protein
MPIGRIYPEAAVLAATQQQQQQQQIIKYNAPTRRRPQVIALFEEIDSLTPLQRHLITERYEALYRDFSRRSLIYSILFYVLRITVTVGSLLVPAMLSIQYTNIGAADKKADYEVSIYWFTWMISFAVTASNGVYTLFKVDKKYYYLVTAFELLKSEAWQYLELTGKYASKAQEQPATHANQYLYFSHALEKHKMKQVEEEYYKFYDHGEDGSSGGGKGQQAQRTVSGIISQQQTHDSLIPPTPDKSLKEISNSLSPETLLTVNSILTSLGKTASPEMIISKIHAAARRASLEVTAGVGAAAAATATADGPKPALGLSTISRPHIQFYSGDMPSPQAT